MIKKILTGSKEFWKDGKDEDFIVIQEQEEVFKHERIDNVCHFCYKPITKQEYFEWHVKENNWYLNTAPLITKEFLEYMGIDIFGDDREIVFNIMKKCFDFVYRNTKPDKWNKYAYRLYIYMCFHKNKSFDLMQDQLDNAMKFKIIESSELKRNELFDFFK